MYAIRSYYEMDVIDSCYQLFFADLNTYVNSEPNPTSDHADSLFNAKIILAESIIVLGGKPAPEGTGEGPKSLNGPCDNMDFETGDLSGWELTRGDVDGSAPYIV